MSPSTSLGIALTGIRISICSWCNHITAEAVAEQSGLTTHIMCDECFHKNMEELEKISNNKESRK
jgi:hypothetical protein